ncbi:cyclin-J-like protein [Anopheles ziemanni]|uniref:cyclin-J-like protein n=1 Tax=Anopheles coustani TaxID=139045 RepID=UPI0026596353|nr:cyclin-J-like protein [Anopheles coustani]XP_058171178.1 cyclin-J-like protein [Anopheles ziemanni]
MDALSGCPSENPCCNKSLCTEYDYDILDNLKENEIYRWKVNLGPSLHESRNAMVEMIRNLAEEHAYRRTTVHLAIYMFDVFMSHHAAVAERLNLVALTCFYVACKIEENEPCIPSTKTLCSFVEDSLTPGDFIAFEVIILNFFNWYVTIPTAATFLDFFAMHSLQMDDFITPSSAAEMSEASFARFKREIIESSLEYLDVTLGHPKMSNVKPSILAAACVAAARCLTPNVRAWNNHLTSVTGYNYQQIHGICSVLVFDLKPLSTSPALKVSTRKRSVTDSGYRSKSEDDSNTSDDDSCSSCSTCSSVECASEASSSSSSSESGETCAKRQKVSYDLK